MSYPRETGERHTVVAIDGPAGSGKSTVARLVADRFGFPLLDTGALYRTVALQARRQGVSWDDEERLAALTSLLDVHFERRGAENRVLLAGEDVSAAIRTPEVSEGASAVSRHPAVRDALLDIQRSFARRGSVVAEGRDVTTVVFPSATVKVYLDASAEERARRRQQQLVAAGHGVSYQEVLEAARQRDRADSERAVAPLKVAADAVRLDTTTLDVDQVVGRIVALVDERRGDLRNHRPRG